MKTKLRLIGSLTAGLILVGGLSACGSDDAKSDTPTTKAGAVTTKAEGTATTAKAAVTATTAKAAETATTKKAEVTTTTKK